MAVIISSVQDFQNNNNIIIDNLEKEKIKQNFLFFTLKPWLHLLFFLLYL